MNKLASTSHARTLQRLLVAVPLAALGLAVAGHAQADIFEDIGLTGGSNTMTILEVKGSGKLTFDKDDFEGGFVAVSEFTGPTVKAEMKCKRSGYRCSKIGDVSLNAKDSEVTKEVAASLGKDTSINSTIDAACKAKKKTVQLQVTVPGVCHRAVWPTVGPKNIKISSPSKPATFNLTCTGYDG